MKIDKVIYINRNCRSDRNVNMVERLDMAGFDYERFEAVEPEALENLPLNNTSNLNPSELACYVSHRLVYMKAREQGWGNTLILEDDAKFTGNIHKLGRALEQLPEDYDICYLGLMPESFELEQEQLLFKPQTEWLAHAYLVNSKCLDVLIDKTARIERSIDHQLYLLQGELNTFDVRPSLIVQDNTKSDLR